MFSLSEGRARLHECAEIIRACGFSEEEIAQILAPLSRAQADATVLGQTKAGKTALVNALSGRPGMLPVDVNPWTSVVTSVHLNQTAADGAAAQFEFYDADGWRSLLDGAGRATTLALRNGGAEEQETLRRQLEALQERARQRLGRNFELLLGQRHRLMDIDSERLSRYVVFGDGAGDAGRYAELTRRADIWLPAPGWDMQITLRDTPGVNDPLLVREQATLEALEEADLGILVLNAAQALATADLGLLRALAALGKSRAVVFVNRIDDLSDPAVQIAEIEASVRDVLGRSGLGTGAPVLFGSANWAAAAMEGGEDALSPVSREAFAAWKRVHPDATLDSASGIPALRALLSGAATEGRGMRHMRDAASALSNRVAARLSSISADLGAAPEDRAEAMLALMDRHSAALDALLETAVGPAFERMRRTVADHAERQAARIRQAVQDKQAGEVQVELQDLRMGLAEQHDEFARKVELGLRMQLDRLAREVERVAAERAGPGAPRLRLSPPEPPRRNAPAALARTVSFDLGERWWKGWFGREARAERRAEAARRLVIEEMEPLLEELKSRRIERYAAEARALQRGFFAACIDALLPEGGRTEIDAFLVKRLAEAQGLAAEVEDALAARERKLA